MTFQEWITSKRGKKVGVDIEERWQSRIVPQRMVGRDGALRYLEAYGKSIASPKTIGLALCAESHGDQAMANEFWRKAYELETGLVAPNEDSAAHASVPLAATRSVASVHFPDFPDQLQPGKVVTMQPTDAKRSREFYINDNHYVGQPKRDGNRMLVWATKDRVVGQKRTMAIGYLTTDMHTILQEVASIEGPFLVDGEFWWADQCGKEHRTAPQAVSANIALGYPEMRPKPIYTIFSALWTKVFGDLTQQDTGLRLSVGSCFADLLEKKSNNFEQIKSAYTKSEKQKLASSQEKAGNEGEVWYDINAKYTGGKNNREEVLVRTKYTKDLDVIVIGLTKTDKTRSFGAIEVGVWDNGKIRPIGSVGTGFTQEEMKFILSVYEAAQSVGGYVLINITTRGFTESGSIWHASFNGLSNRRSEECTMDQEETNGSS